MLFFDCSKYKRGDQPKDTDRYIYLAQEDVLSQDDLEINRRHKTTQQQNT